MQKTLATKKRKRLKRKTLVQRQFRRATRCRLDFILCFLVADVFYLGNLRNLWIQYRMRLSFASLTTFLLAVSLSAQQQAAEPGDIQRVLLVDATQSVQMKDSVASSKGSSIVIVSKQFYVFKGPKASLRTKTRLPEFQFEMDPAFDDAVYLYRFDVHSDRREIRVAKGSGGLAVMSIPEDHLIETALEEIGAGQNSNRRYRLKPKSPLPPGEYCLSRRISNCYDFGVD